MRKQTEQTQAMGVITMRSIRLFEKMLPTVLNAKMAKPNHVPARSVAGCQGDVATPVLARTIHTAKANGTTEITLASLR